MFWEKRIEQLATRLRAHDIPLRIALWDDQVFDLCAEPKVTFRVKSPASLRYLVSAGWT